MRKKIYLSCIDKRGIEYMLSFFKKKQHNFSNLSCLRRWDSVRRDSAATSEKIEQTQGNVELVKNYVTRQARFPFE